MKNYQISILVLSNKGSSKNSFKLIFKDIPILKI